MESAGTPMPSDEHTLMLIQLGEHSVSIHRRKSDSAGRHVYSRLLVCPLCHRLWAKLLVEGEGYAMPEGVPCEDCKHFESFHDDEVPGSILEQGHNTPLDWDLLDLLPPDLLYREFYLHLNHFNQGFTQDERNTIYSRIIDQLGSFTGAFITKRSQHST